MTLPNGDDAIVGMLVAAVELRDPQLAEHGRRTAEIACAIGALMGCGVDTLDHLYSAALLHDVGKLGVPESILWKPAALTRSEWKVIRTHPETGHQLVADVVDPQVAGSVLYHHERLDGRGYPYGIEADQIPTMVSIVQVADAFDAMTSDRPYQRAMSTRLAVAELRRCSSTQFDPEVAEVAARLFESNGDPRPPRELRHAPEHGLMDSGEPELRPGLIKLRDRPA